MVDVRESPTLRTIPLLIAACFIALPAYAKYSGGTGEPNDPYQIATAADLIALGDYDNHFILTADIDPDPNLPGRKVFDRAVIAPDTNDVADDFQVTHSTSQVGLFGQLSPGSEVRDMGVVNVNITGSDGLVGGLAGYSQGNLTNCHSTGAVSGGTLVGGLVGYNFGALTSCYSTAAVSSTMYAGGLVGYCRNDGDVVSSFWHTEISGLAWSWAGTGKTTAEMQIATTFLDAGWDFVDETANGTEDIWWILEGKGYPRLWWEPAIDD